MTLSPTVIVTGFGAYAKFTMLTPFVAATGAPSAIVEPRRRSVSEAIESRTARAISRIRYE